MPHGTPDWGLVGPISVLYGLDDLGEQAVRLGAVSSWDRIGHVVFQDNFSEGVGAWYSIVSSADGTICPFTENALSSPFCIRMVNGSGGATYARMNHYLGYGYRGRCGLECNIAFGPDIEYIKFGFFSSLPTGRQLFYVRFTPATGLLEHGMDPAPWTAFDNVGILGGNIWEWRNVKLVVDFVTGFFDKFVFLGTVYDMSAIPCQTMVILAPWNWHILIENDSTTDDQYEMHLDDVIVTIDEP